MAPCPAARSVAAGHPSWRGVTSVHGREDSRPPIGGRSQLFMTDARRRRRTRGEAFHPWPVGELSGHEPPLAPRRERAFRRRPRVPKREISRLGARPRDGTAPSSFAPEPPLFFSVFSMPLRRGLNRPLYVNHTFAKPGLGNSVVPLAG